MEVYYIILFVVAVSLFVIGFIFGRMGKKADTNFSDTFYSNTGSFSLTSDFDYEKSDDDGSPVIIESVMVEDGLDNN